MAAAALLLLLLSPFVLLSAAADEPPETTTHIHLYWHDVLSGPDATAVRVANAGAVTAASPTFFGRVVVLDNAMTEGPDRNASAPLGRGQGIYAFADKATFALHMSMNFVFQAGEHNGSTLAIVGHNQIFTDVREMPVVGGTGKFRWARGYALARTVALDNNTGDATVEYNIFVRHGL